MSAERTEGGERVCAFAPGRRRSLGSTSRFNRPQSPDAGRPRALGSPSRFNPLSRLRRQLPPRGSGSARAAYGASKVLIFSPPRGGDVRGADREGRACLCVRRLDVTSRSAAQAGSTGLSRRTPARFRARRGTTAPPEGERVSVCGVRGERVLTRSGAIPDLLPPAGGRCPRSGQRGANVSVRSPPGRPRALGSPSRFNRPQSASPARFRARRGTTAPPEGERVSASLCIRPLGGVRAGLWDRLGRRQADQGVGLGFGNRSSPPRPHLTPAPTPGTRRPPPRRPPCSCRSNRASVRRPLPACR